MHASGLGTINCRRYCRRRPGDFHPAIPACYRAYLQGDRIRRGQGPHAVPGMVVDAMNGNIELAAFVTHGMELEAINDAFDLMREGKSITVRDPL